MRTIAWHNLRNISRPLGACCAIPPSTVEPSLLQRTQRGKPTRNGNPGHQKRRRPLFSRATIIKSALLFAISLLSLSPTSALAFTADVSGRETFNIKGSMFEHEKIALHLEVQKADATWSATDRQNNMLTGSVISVSRSGRRLGIELNSDSLDAWITSLEDRGSRLVGSDIALILDEPPRFGLRVNRKQTRLFASAQLSFTATVAGQKTKAIYRFQARGPIDSLFAGLEGVWRSEGYGYVLEIEENSYSIYDITEFGCVEHDSGPRWQLDHQFTAVEPTESPDRIVAVRELRVTRLVWNREPELPVSCKPELLLSTLDPETNFEVLWHTFNENYAFFQLRDMSWDDQYRAFRPEVTPDTPEEVLFEIFAAMLLPLNDCHLHLESVGLCTTATEIALYEEFLAQSEFQNFQEYFNHVFEKTRAIIRDRYLDGQVRTAANGKLEWGKLSETVGYLNILGMLGLGTGSV